MKVGMVQRSGVLDQPLAGRGGVRPKPLLFVMVFHAKPFNFLCEPLKLGLKYVGCPNHRPLALGMVLIYSVGPKDGLSR
jgi:hypothetical protein